jgi:hypothetical protein
MRADDPNLPHLRTIAQALGDLREQVVFVGGAVAGLLLTDPLADTVRATRDVDAVIRASRVAYYRAEEDLKQRGFVQDTDSGVICRWIHRGSGVVFDLMPMDSDVLGFSNRWYPYAVDTAMEIQLEPGVPIRLATAVAFVATKLEAFADRGRGDIMTSHDLEDVLNIVDGRPELAAELDGAPPELQEAVRGAFGRLVAHPDFNNLLPGLVAETERATVVAQRLGGMAM